MKSRNFLKGQILRKEITIETIKDKKGKYERYIGKIWLKNEKGKEININDLLVKKCFAVYKEY
ncbi:MAG: thermonuclease family protein [Ignavibacteria bacterium]|nr:thermonuclease family protein [Ignavibacteria bacterium]